MFLGLLFPGAALAFHRVLVAVDDALENAPERNEFVNKSDRERA